ncbi:MAG: sulfatase-like hydrolase/transferase [Chthoniobacter sp.]|nr:sulfatase-like hydrolase/transferase [Chthoniobacter sp.]
MPTPQLDALAASGVRFTSGYMSGPYCSPTRAALLAGRKQERDEKCFPVSGRNGGCAPLAEGQTVGPVPDGGSVTSLPRPRRRGPRTRWR